jgi:hypothetical protein
MTFYVCRGDVLTSQLLVKLADLVNRGESQTASDYLARTLSLLEADLPVDVIVCYELVPKTGMPRVPPLCVGSLSGPVCENLNTVSPMGVVAYLVSRWRYVSHRLDDETRRPGPFNGIKNDPYIDFMSDEGLIAFDFLPLGTFQNRLAAVLLNYRWPVSEHEHWLTEACAAVIQTGLLYIHHKTNSHYVRKRRMATAHTLYNDIANQFRGQIETLEMGVHDLLESLDVEMPEALSRQIQDTERTVFELMRNLVLRASGDILVDLRQMDLYKALHTMAAALERAWPPTRQVKIDIHSIPPVIDRQDLELRQLLYALIVEAVGNAIKHGGPAPYTSVNVKWADRQIYVQVIDHGDGFEPSTTQYSEHGLGFWQTVIEEHLAGTLHIASAPDHGTVVTARIPVIPTRRSHNVRNS